MADKVKDPVDKGMVRVLVYGTLKKGHSNHILLEEADAIFLGYDSITGPYNMWDLGSIPAVMDSSKGQRKIRGELWAVDTEGLAALDLLEGHPTLYQRRKLVTDVHERRAWIYMLQSTGFLHEHVSEVTAQLWHASPDENKFWLTNDYKKATA